MKEEEETKVREGRMMRRRGRQGQQTRWSMGGMEGEMGWRSGEGGP